MCVEYITRTYIGTEEAELYIFGRQGKAKVQKRNFRSLEVPAETIFGIPGRTSAEDERSPGRAVVHKAELQIFGSQGRAEMRKRNFTPLEVPIER